MSRDGQKEIWGDVSKGDASEIEKAHKVWLSKLPPKYCDKHKEVQLILNAEESISRVKKYNDVLKRYVMTPELASNNWRFYFVGQCAECNWQTRAMRVGISRLYRNFSFDNFKCDKKNLESIVERAKSYAKDPHGFLLLQGGYGTGKTHFAMSILRETSLSFNYVSHSDLIQEYRNFHYNKSNTDSDEDDEESRRKRIHYLEDGEIKSKIPSRYEILKDYSLLCIDEFGFVNQSQDEAIITFDILNYRIQELLPTILLTNYPTEQLEKIIGPRLLDRIKQALYASLQLGFTSKRKSMNSLYLEKASRKIH